MDLRNAGDGVRAHCRSEAHARAGLASVGRRTVGGFSAGRSEPARLSEHARRDPGNSRIVCRQYRSRRSRRRLRAAVEGLRIRSSAVPQRRDGGRPDHASSTTRCKTHPRLKTDPTFCAVAVYRGSWEQPDVKFATDVAAIRREGRCTELRHAARHEHGDLRHGR